MKTAGIFDLPHIRPLGRWHAPSARRAGALPLLWAGSGLELRFTGSELHLLIEARRTSPPWSPGWPRNSMARRFCVCR